MPPNWTLPALGDREGQELDFKGKMEKLPDGSPNHFEMGKDMAALANAYGGRVIVGAFEKDSALSKYDTLTETEALEVCNHYTKAQAQRLEPSVQVQAKPVKHDSGYAAVICVEPSMGNAIGVRVVTKEIADEEPKAPKEVYAFPIRDGDHTNYMKPEQLSMLMIPELRRTIILLRQAKGHPIKVERVYGTSKEYAGQGVEHIDRIDPDTNQVKFQDGSYMALSQIKHVWKQGEMWWLTWVSH